MLTGDLGESFATRRPVTEVLLEAAPISVWLGVVSLALTFLIGVPIGMLQAARRGSNADRSLTVLTSTVYAIPTFWLALAMSGVDLIQGNFVQEADAELAFDFLGQNG